MQPGPAVLVASRQVQNAHTGLDLSVPTYQEFRGKMMSGHIEYQIMVVTWLPAFKSAKHRAEDIVQFMVSRKYSEIEEFYQKLTSRYPQAALPSFPRKILFVGESDIRDRRAAFNDIMHQIAKNGELATSPELLAFLGTKSSGGTDLPGRGPPEQKNEADGDAEDGVDFFQEQDMTVGGGPLPRGLSHSGEEEKEEDEEEEGEALDPLGIMRSKKPQKPPASVQARPKKAPAGPGRESRPKLTIFDDEADEDDKLFGAQLSHVAPHTPSRDSLRLFKDPDLGGKVSLGDSLLLPTACERHQEPALGPAHTDINDGLFGVDEDLEKILSLGSAPRPQALPRAKPRGPTKPAIPKKPVIPPPKAGAATVRAALREDQRPVQVQALNELDILRYIQDQNSAHSTAPSLF